MMQMPIDNMIKESIRQIHFWLSGYIEGVHQALDEGAEQKYEGLDPSHLDALDCVMQYLDELTEQPKSLPDIGKLALWSHIIEKDLKRRNRRKKGMPPCLMLRIKIIEKFGTSSDFAQAIKEDESIISKVIWGKRNLSPEKQEKWAKVLACNSELLFFKRKGDPKHD
jgi:hypothetical protein